MKGKLLFLLCVTVLAMIPVSVRISPATDSNNPIVGIYDLGMTVTQDETGYDVEISIELTGFNESAAWYNLSLIESLTAIRLEIPEMGWYARDVIDIVMATSNATIPLFQPYPITAWSVNSSGVETSFHVAPRGYGSFAFRAIFEFESLIITGLAIGQFQDEIFIEEIVTINEVLEPVSLDIAFWGVSIIAVMALALSVFMLTKK